MLDRTELIPVADGERRAHRPDRLPVRPGHALGAARLRGRVLHARGHDHPHRRLQARPHAGRRPPHRSRAARRARPPRRRRAPVALRLDERGAARASRRRSRRSAPRCVRCSASTPTKRFIVASFASHLHRVEQVAQAAIAHGRKVAFVGRSMEQNVSMARERGVRRPARVRGHRHRGDRAVRARRRVHHLHRFAGRADERALAHGRARAQAREGLGRRRRGDQRARDPGQRVERVARDRLAAPRRRRGRARPHVAGARLGSRVAGRAEVHAQPAVAGVVRAGARRVPPSRAPRAASRTRSVSPTTTCSCARTATSSRSAAHGLDVERRAVPAGLHVRRRHRRRRRATACCATGACSPRKASSS